MAYPDQGENHTIEYVTIQKRSKKRKYVAAYPKLPTIAENKRHWIAMRTIVREIDWGYMCATKIVATSKCELNCINDLNDLGRKAARHEVPKAGTLLVSDRWKLLWVHFVAHHGDQLERITHKEVMPEEEPNVDLNADAKSCKSAEVERAQDKPWDIKAFKQLEVFHISLERLDAQRTAECRYARPRGQGQRRGSVDGSCEEGSESGKDDACPPRPPT